MTKEKTKQKISTLIMRLIIIFIFTVVMALSVLSFMSEKNHADTLNENNTTNMASESPF